MSGDLDSGSGGGDGSSSDDSDGIEADAFINMEDTPSIKWGFLFSTLIGSYFLGWWSVAVSFLINLRESIGDLVLGLGGAAAAIVSNLLGIPIDAVAAAFVETASWLGLFGPLAFPLGIAVTMITLDLTRRGISRVL